MQRRASLSLEHPALSVHTPTPQQTLAIVFPANSTARTQLVHVPNTLRDVEMSLPPEGLYPTFDALFDACQAWSLSRGYAFVIGKSVKKQGSLREKVYLSCDRVYKAKEKESSRVRRGGTRGTGCEFGVIAAETLSQTGWELKHRPDSKFGRHNHAPSTSPAAHPSHRKMPPKTRDLNRILYDAGKSYTLLGREPNLIGHRGLPTTTARGSLSSQPYSTSSTS